MYSVYSVIKKVIMNLLGVEVCDTSVQAFVDLTPVLSITVVETPSNDESPQIRSSRGSLQQNVGGSGNVDPVGL